MPTTTRRSTNFLLTLATVSAVSLSAAAQTSNFLQSQAAPIERPQTAQPQYTQQALPPRIRQSQPAQGVWLGLSANGKVTTVAATPERTELRLDSGIANITVHHPAHASLILVDLDGGQVALIKDGLYTFNAQTKTVRTLVGESEAFVGTDANSGAKPVKVKEQHALTFGAPVLKAIEFQPFQAGSDLLPRSSAYARNDGAGYGYGYGPYGDGFYGGYPYFAYGYAYPYGYYPGFGLGFGYYGGFGGFYGGGFGGGYGGFRGRR